MSKAIGIKDFMGRKFDTYDFDGKWLASFGKAEKNFRMIIYGKSGNGKTEFAMQLSKYLAGFNKVYYNSFEQGISQSLQDCLVRNGMMDVQGKVIFGDKENLEEMIERLKKRNSPSIVVIDSRDYLNLTAEQFKQLIQMFPRKAFIILCWEANDKPKGEYAKAIEFMTDIKIQVKNFKAFPRSRFGGNEVFVIWDKPQTAAVETVKVGMQTALF